ncbi:MAG TPA: [FeFe] hydrogenase H-cluster radical SAM maturase HydG [Atribacteraceae bacterium]|nr:[FeFe] hydrogenase H-cluster radical SAM maturase HydG [Atribacteraceae bacterium]
MFDETCTVNTEKADFIREAEIVALLREGEVATPEEVRAVIERSGRARGLSLREVAMLLGVEDETLIQEMFAVARQIKDQIYGKRVVLFAPLYISNYCVNNCGYCGYRAGNRFARRKLTQRELADEVAILENMGHKRIALEAGEHPDECPLEYVLEAIQTVYAVRNNQGSIRRINVNIAATGEEEYARLKASGIGTYILFQETYHRGMYAKMHPSGPKADYDWHTTAHDRAMRAGLDDVGIGVLFGLYDYAFETLALFQHARHLESEFGVGPHTVSVPRLKPASGINPEQFPHRVSDREFMKVVAIIRLALPYTGMILSTRENVSLRTRLLDVGISQISAGSCTGVGGYKKEAMNEQRDGEVPQFNVEDRRSPDEVLADVCRYGYLPSFCTACYRTGRTGERFMALAKAGEIQNVCQPNAILTFREYLLDYGTPETRLIGEQTLREHLARIPNVHIRRLTEERLGQIERGERDLSF